MGKEKRNQTTRRKMSELSGSTRRFVSSSEDSGGRKRPNIDLIEEERNKFWMTRESRASRIPLRELSSQSQELINAFPAPFIQLKDSKTM
jgi:hypothetical protein